MFISLFIGSLIYTFLAKYYTKVRAITGPKEFLLGLFQKYTTSFFWVICSSGSLLLGLSNINTPWFSKTMDKHRAQHNPVLKFKFNCRIFKMVWSCRRHGSIKIVLTVTLEAQNYRWMNVQQFY